MPERRSLDIAFFVDAFPDLSVTFVIDQVVGMLARGHRVRVFAQRPGRADREHPDVGRWRLPEITTYIGPALEQGRRMRDLLTVLGTQPRRAVELAGTLPPFTRDPFARTLRLFFAAAALREPLCCDVVHCHFGPNGALVASLQSKGLVRAPFVTTFHGYDMRIAEPSNGAIYSVLRERGDRFLAISGYNRSLLEKWGFDPRKIHAHRVGIDVEQFTYREPRGDVRAAIRLLSVANLVPVKGHVFLLRALRRLLDERPTVRLELRLVGEGTQRPDIEQQIVALGLGDHVALLGGLARDAVMQELARADLFVLPSLAEATPVALMEAQACGLPVVATRVGAVHEVVDDGSSGILVPPADADELASALGQLLDRRDTWAAMGRRGRAHVLESYHLPRLLDQLERIYAEIVDPV